ncbi:MAG: HD domain-containing phosphohydrolase [bacterium]
MKISEETITATPILVVDDSMMSLREIETILENGGFTDVRLLNDPTRVVENYEEERPGLIILDYYMPEMTGEDVLDTLNSRYPDRRMNVLFWTSADEDELYTRALRKGARDVLRKENVRDEEIVTRVRNLIESNLYYRELKRQNQQLNRKVRRRTQQLERTSLETIGRLAQAAEFRDNETGGHIHRIGVMAEKLSRLLGIDESICEAIRYAAPMHDVGKIGVSDQILFKPDDLTENEWSQMKKHTTFGARILSGSDQHYLKLARNIALYHHEQWDGSGYPEGLKGGEIPVEARITSVCDVFDAVLSDRPYKEPWEKERAINLILEERGDQFDPDVADCFLENVDVFLELRDRVDTSNEDQSAFLSEDVSSEQTVSVF